MGSAAEKSTSRHFAGYVIRKLLGRGGMAEVFLAEKVDAASGAKKEIALKRVLPQFAEDPERVARFLDEMRIAVQLEHANIVTVLDFGQEGGTPYLTLELVRGLDVRSLAQKLARLAGAEPPIYPGQERGILPPAVVAWVGMQAAKGLGYAHRQRRYETDETGVIHRDIDPSNLMVDIHGEVKINDWGISKALKGDQEVLTETAHAYGKPLYAPPEQLMGKGLDATADLYALGVTLFELLTGRHPYDDPAHPKENPWAKLGRAAKTERKPIAELLPEAPRSMQELLEELIQGDRAKRGVGSAEEVARSLKEVCKELAGDIEEAQKQAAELVQLVYEQGPPTVLEMEGMKNPEAWPESHRRPVSDPTRSARPAAESAGTPATVSALPPAPHAPLPRTVPLSDSSPSAASGPLPAPISEPISEPVLVSAEEPVAASAPRRSRTLLWVALLAASALLALLAGLAGFVLAGGEPEPSGTTPTAEEVPADGPAVGSGEETVATGVEPASADTNAPEVTAPAAEEPATGGDDDLAGDRPDPVAGPSPTASPAPTPESADRNPSTEVQSSSRTGSPPSVRSVPPRRLTPPPSAGSTPPRVTRPGVRPRDERPGRGAFGL
jgi:serine/threonine protein kinase